MGIFAPNIFESFIKLIQIIMNKKTSIIIMFAFFVTALSWMPVNAQQNVRDLRGDVNYDDEVDINDATDLIDYVLTGDWGDSTETSDTYSNKVFGVLGDSFTQANKWQKTMCELLGAKLIGVEGPSVGGIGGGRYGGDDPAKWALTQAQNLYSYCSANNLIPDYILVCNGTNDIANMWSDGGNQMGAFNPNATAADIGNSLVIDKAHMIAGMQATFLYLQDKFPNAVILVGNTPGGWLHTSSNYIYLPFTHCFEENLKMVCNFYGIEFIDNYFCIPQGSSNVDNSGHPTEIGHQRIGEYMATMLMNRMR